MAPSPANGHHVTPSAVGSGDGDPDRSALPVPVEIKVSPMLDSSGRITGLVVVFRDISERRRQAERQALLLETASDLIRASEPGELGRATFWHASSVLGALVCMNYCLDTVGQHLKAHARAWHTAEEAGHGPVT